VVGVGLTIILPNTLEDVLAVSLAGLAAYIALLNLPLRRAEAKAKLERVANNFVQVGFPCTLRRGETRWQCVCLIFLRAWSNMKVFN
jgi:hypothetical protein